MLLCKQQHFFINYPTNCKFRFSNLSESDSLNLNRLKAGRVGCVDTAYPNVLIFLHGSCCLDMYANKSHQHLLGNKNIRNNKLPGKGKISIFSSPIGGDILQKNVVE